MLIVNVHEQVTGVLFTWHAPLDTVNEHFRKYSTFKSTNLGRGRGVWELRSIRIHQCWQLWTAPYDNQLNINFVCTQNTNTCMSLCKYLHTICTVPCKPCFIVCLCIVKHGCAVYLVALVIWLNVLMWMANVFNFMLHFNFVKWLFLQCALPFLWSSYQHVVDLNICEILASVSKNV